MQETMLRAWRHPQVLDQSQGSARAWLFTVARRIVIDDWRTSRSRHEVVTAEPPEQQVADATEKSADAAVVTAALRQLSLEHRQVVLECYYRGSSVAEAARAARRTGGNGQVARALRAARLAPGSRRDGRCAVTSDPFDDVRRSVRSWRALRRRPSRVRAAPPRVRRIAPPRYANSRGCRDARPRSRIRLDRRAAAALAAADAATSGPARHPPRRRWIVGGLAAAAAACLIAVAVVVLRPDAAPARHSAAMVAVTSAPITATADVRSVGWGTKIELVCRYNENSEPARPYALVVVDRSGTRHQLGSWLVKAGKVTTYQSGISLTRARSRKSTSPRSAVCRCWHFRSELHVMFRRRGSRAPRL